MVGCVEYSEALFSTVAIMSSLNFILQFCIYHNYHTYTVYIQRKRAFQKIIEVPFEG